MAAKDHEGLWRGGCRNHAENRFGGCSLFTRKEGSSRCDSCGCVARCHVHLGKCEKHSYCRGYDEIGTSVAVAECANCGCSPKEHTRPISQDSDDNKNTGTSVAPDSADVWDNIRKLAGEERKNQLQRKPPLKMNGKKNVHHGGHGKKNVHHGGARPMAGRKKSKPKELLVTPVKIKNMKLGHYIPKGKKEFIPFQETEFTIEAVEEVLCSHFLGVGRILAKSSFNFHIMRTLKGPPLKNNLHLTGTSFYFWWQSLVTTDEIEDSPDWFADIDLDELPGDEQLFNSLSHSSINTGYNSSGSLGATSKSGHKSTTGSASTHEGSLQSTPSSGQKSSGNGSTVSSVVRHQLSVRAEHLANLKFLRTAVRSNIPKQPLPTPSKILLLGRSVAIPKPQYNGVPAEVYLYSLSDDWCSINVEGPEHSVIVIDEYPEKPFASGCFQVAFTARVISVGGKFLIKDKPYVFKQHKVQEYGLMEDSQTDSTSELTEEFLQQLRTANEKKTAKEVQVAAVCCSLCYHFNEECKQKIPDYGKELNVLPSVHVKLLSGQCPAWGLVEPCIQGTWYKFLNNDAQEVALGDNLPEQVAEFSQKSLTFAHWSFNYFKQRALVCDLQGADFNLTDLEIASNDISLFGIGNLSDHALGMFKANHRCNVYCAALDLEGFHNANADLGQVLASLEVTFHPRHTLNALTDT